MPPSHATAPGPFPARGSKDWTLLTPLCPIVGLYSNVPDAGDGETVTLETCSDDHHGFLRMDVTKTLVTKRYYQVPRPQEPRTKGSQRFDHWQYDIKHRRWVPNHL